jgi:peptide/nickel transport system substrate-binding protein
MDYRGRRAPGQEVDGSRGASAPHLSPLQRRTFPWIWCGVFFFSSLTLAGCRTAAPEASPPDSQLTIGVPEAGIASAEVGIRELTNILTLEGLTQVHVSIDGRALPRLAEKWTWEQDGLQLRLTLRPGVIFHDGTPLEPNIAAKLVQDAIARPGNRALYPSLNDIREVRPDGEREILIELSQRSALLPEDLHFPLAIRNGTEEFGTGSYRVASRESGQVVLEGVDQYYLGAPKLRRLVVSPFEGIRTAWASLLRGEVDMITDVPAEAQEFLRSDDINVLSFPRSYQFLVAFNMRRSPLNSPNVRRALNLAIDRQALIANVLQGHGVAATGPFWPRHWAYDASVGSSGFDRTFATSLLDRAGLTPGAGTASEIPGARLRFTCLMPARFAVLERIALDLQKQLYEIGVDMQFQVVPAEEYNLRIRSGQFDAVLIEAISGPTLARPFVFWASAKRLNGLNVFAYENAEADRLFQVLRDSTNEGAVRSAVSRLQRVLLDDPPAMFLAWSERTRAFRRDFQVVLEKDRDPLYTIWQWTENTDRQSTSTQ